MKTKRRKKYNKKSYNKKSYNKKSFRKQSYRKKSYKKKYLKGGALNDVEKSAQLLNIKDIKNINESNIERSYRIMAKKYHPDRNFGKEEWAAEHFKEIQKAKETLIQYLNHPLQARQDGPSQARQDGPSQARQDGPSQARQYGPSQARQYGPSQARQDEYYRNRSQSTYRNPGKYYHFQDIDIFDRTKDYSIEELFNQLLKFMNINPDIVSRFSIELTRLYRIIQFVDVIPFTEYEFMIKHNLNIVGLIYRLKMHMTNLNHLKDMLKANIDLAVQHTVMYLRRHPFNIYIEDINTNTQQNIAQDTNDIYDFIKEKIKEKYDTLNHMIYILNEKLKEEEKRKKEEEKRKKEEEIKMREEEVFKNRRTQIEKEVKNREKKEREMREEQVLENRRIQIEEEVKNREKKEREMREAQVLENKREEIEEQYADNGYTEEDLQDFQEMRRQVPSRAVPQASPRSQPPPRSQPRAQPLPSQPRARPLPSQPRAQPLPSQPRARPLPSQPRARPLYPSEEEKIRRVEKAKEQLRDTKFRTANSRRRSI